MAFLGQYEAASTDQLARLIWRGNHRLARRHLLRLFQDGILTRLPHPLHRKGPFVWSLGDRSTAHSQKVLHTLAAVELHVALITQFNTEARIVKGLSTVKIQREMPWARGLVPDQTLILKDHVWAVEHHLSGPFQHSRDYHGFVKDSQYRRCPWWRKGVKLGLLVVAGNSTYLDPIRVKLTGYGFPPEFPWKVATMDAVLQDPGHYLSD